MDYRIYSDEMINSMRNHLEMINGQIITYPKFVFLCGAAYKPDMYNVSNRGVIDRYIKGKTVTLLEEAFACKDDLATRATKLHDAEKLLLTDMPVIPIIFNQNAYLVSGELSKYETSYYGFRIFNKLTLKDYIKYLDIETEAE